MTVSSLSVPFPEGRPEDIDWSWDDPEIERRPTRAELAEMERDRRKAGA